MNTSYKYETYFQFVESLGVLKKSPQFAELDPVETQLLDQISLQWRQGKPLLVNEAISLETIGSRATLHARVKQLRKKGYIDFHSDIDGRKKIIKPTILAMNYFASISNLMKSIVEQNTIYSTNEFSESRTHSEHRAVLVG